MRRWLGTFTLVLALATIAYAVKPAPTTISVQVGSAVRLTLETALTPESRERGLMQRKTLAPYDGMVFFFPKAAPYKFWMKDTLIPLDMVFVDEAGTVVYIATAKPLSLEMVGPKTTIDTVIEIAGGRAAREGIRLGDKVRYETKQHPHDLAR